VTLSPSGSRKRRRRLHVLLAAARGRRQGRDVKQPCKKHFVIKRVPYSPDAKVSGANVKVTLPDGRELTETVVVEDVLVVAIGDSFMSGESNPDKPCPFSPSREMVYEPDHRQQSRPACFARQYRQSL
jgi:hypothetical protein